MLTDLPPTPCRVIGGALPAGLAGRYVRNGPNSPVEPAGPYVYPIDGDGMLHELAFDGEGGVRYRRARVRTPMLEAEIAAGRPLWGTVMMGLQPLPGAPVTGRKDLPDVNVIDYCGRLIALAEQTRSYDIGADDLRTIGPVDFAGQYPGGATAHPKVDPSTGNLVVFSYGLRPPFLTWCELDRAGQVVRPTTVVDGLDAPLLMHDCAITEQHLIVPAYPLVFDPLRTVTTDGPPLQWQPTRATRIAVIDRASGHVTWLETEPRWSWHTANAFIDGSRIQLDVMSYDAFAMDDRLGAIERFTLDPSAGTVNGAIIADRAGEFPRIDDRRLGRPHGRIAAATNAGAARAPGTFDSIVEIDTSTGTATRWASDGEALGEPILIPVDGHDCWGVLTAVGAGGRSAFLLFAAGDVASGPIARIELPDRAPAGLHGSWLPA